MGDNQVRVVADCATHEGSERSGHDPACGQMVVVRPQIVETISHVLGNCFQRLYHLIERTRAGDAAGAAQLEASARQLEDFLQLVMDYVTPLSLTLQDVSANEIVQSLASQVSDAVGGAVRVDVKLPASARLLVDPGRLTRAFWLLAMQLRPGGDPGNGLEMKAFVRPGERALALAVKIREGYVSRRSSESEMQWAVAEKLFDVHGGVLQHETLPSGEVLWEIALPLQP